MYMNNEVVGLHLEAEGFFQIRKFSADGEMVSDRTIKNLITNNGLDLIGKEDDWMTKCYIGRSNTQASATQTSLVDRIAIESTFNPDSDAFSVVTGSTPYIEISRTFQFAETGSDIEVREIGVGVAENSLFSRTVVSTETVRSDETLIVRYIHRWYTSSSNISSGSVDISGSNHTSSIRVCDFSASSIGSGIKLPRGFNNVDAENIYVSFDALTAIGSKPTPLVSGVSSASVANYSNGYHNRRVTLSWSTSNGNISNGIRTIVIPNFGVFSYQIQFSPNIGKNS